DRRSVDAPGAGGGRRGGGAGGGAGGGGDRAGGRGGGARAQPHAHGPGPQRPRGDGGHPPRRAGHGPLAPAGLHPLRDAGALRHVLGRHRPGAHPAPGLRRPRPQGRHVRLAGEPGPVPPPQPPRPAHLRRPRPGGRRRAARLLPRPPLEV
ncbi:MAG: tRNA-specific adenosine-34 deaminase, partial [uncultured Gemmatimonadetes bacterium]